MLMRGMRWIRSSKLFAMVQALHELIRERSQIPLEALCVSGLVLVASFRSELCGHVHAKPPARVYIAVYIISLLTFLDSFARVLSRLLDVRFRSYQENRRSQLSLCPVCSSKFSSLCFCISSNYIWSCDGVTW